MDPAALAFNRTMEPRDASRRARFPVRRFRRRSAGAKTASRCQFSAPPYWSRRWTLPSSIGALQIAAAAIAWRTTLAGSRASPGARDR